MSIPIYLQAIAAVGIVGVAASCAHESYTDAGYATTTAAIVSNDTAVLQVAKARCRRADECNRLGNGQKYVDRAQCIQAYLDPGANVRVLRSCPGDVDKARLDKCLAVLATQHCDADLGPVTVMPDCGSYCASGQ